MAMESVLRYIEANQGRYIEELKQFLRIPSISTAKKNRPDMDRCAEFVKEELRRIGIPRVETFPTDGHPIVYGEWLEAPEKPTVLFYGHYDIQPVDPLELWTTGPFEPTIRNGELYARGAADDKGPVWMHFKAVEAHLKAVGRLPVNVKFLIEGEEEIGSAHLDEFIRRHRDLLKADVALISDTAMFSRNLPSISYGLRGLAYFQLDIKGSNRDLHSGSFGGAVINPNFALAQVILSIKNTDGQILIPGFYDDVLSISEQEKKELSQLPFDEEKFQRDLGVPELFGEKDYGTIERLWYRPTLEINGMYGGFIGEGAKTVIPARASAKISMRLVPNQDPDRIAALFETHLRSITPASVELTLTRMQGGKPWVTSTDQPSMRIASRAFKKGFGKTPVFIRQGGSIPVVATFRETLGLSTVLMGVGLPDENAHAPNEKLDLGNFQNGIVTSAYFFQEFVNLESNQR